jgi:hypothetical protein
MPFSKQVRIEALIACQRHCCLCLKRKHTRIACHHIVQEADGGEDTFENCIPLCPDCHAEVKAYDHRHHPGMTSYSTGELVRRRDDWYQIIRRRSEDLGRHLGGRSAAVPSSPALQGELSFDYSNNDGCYLIGEGNAEFLTRWTHASKQSIHAYTDRTNVAIALAGAGTSLGDLNDASSLDFSSRVRTPSIQEILVLENHQGRYAAIKVLELKSRSRGDDRDWARMAYWILPDGSTDFTTKA